MLLRSKLFGFWKEFQFFPCVGGNELRYSLDGTKITWNISISPGWRLFFASRLFWINGAQENYSVFFFFFKTNLTELKTFGSPPVDVTNVTAAVMVLLQGGSNGKVPKDRSWKAAKLMMGKVFHLFTVVLFLAINFENC